MTASSEVKIPEGWMLLSSFLSAFLPLPFLCLRVPCSELTVIPSKSSWVWVWASWDRTTDSVYHLSKPIPCPHTQKHLLWVRTHSVHKSSALQAGSLFLLLFLCHVQTWCCLTDNTVVVCLLPWMLILMALWPQPSLS